MKSDNLLPKAKIKKGPYAKPTNDLTRYEKLIRHFSKPNDFPLTPQLEEYIDRLQLVRDLLYAHPMTLAKKILIKQMRQVNPNYSYQQAHNDVQETIRFFALDSIEQRKTEFWLTLSIQHHEDLLKTAKLMAKTTKDFAHCSEIQHRIDKLRGLHEKQNSGIDYSKLEPSVLVIQVGGKNIKPEDLPKELGDKLMNMIEDVEFSVEDMQAELEKNAGKDTES